MLVELSPVKLRLTEGLRVEAAHIRLALAIANLVANAYQALPGGGGLLGVRTEHGEAPDEVRVIVEDAGKGMSPEELELALQRFRTTRRARRTLRRTLRRTFRRTFRTTAFLRRAAFLRPAFLLVFRAAILVLTTFLSDGTVAARSRRASDPVCTLRSELRGVPALRATLAFEWPMWDRASRALVDASSQRAE